MIPDLMGLDVVTHSMGLRAKGVVLVYRWCSQIPPGGLACIIITCNLFSPLSFLFLVSVLLPP